MNKMTLNGCWQGECIDINSTKKFDFTGNVPFGYSTAKRRSSDYGIYVAIN